MVCGSDAELLVRLETLMVASDCTAMTFFFLFFFPSQPVSQAHFRDSIGRTLRVCLLFWWDRLVGAARGDDRDRECHVGVEDEVVVAAAAAAVAVVVAAD